MSQNMDALGQGNLKRLAVAAIRREVKALDRQQGILKVADLLDQQTPDVGHLQCWELLTWPKSAQTPVMEALLERSGVDYVGRRVRDLTDRQRGEVVRRLRDMGGATGNLAPIRACKICHARKPRDMFPAGRGFSCQACVDERIPSLPFAVFIAGMADRAAVTYLWGSHRDPLIEEACQRAGISPRVLSMWRCGERPYLQFDAADRVLIDLGVLWWDVFTEATVRRSALEVGVWRFRWKRATSGRSRRRVMELVGTARYGDAGPDLGELERIRRAFEGDPLEAAA